MGKRQQVEEAFDLLVTNVLRRKRRNRMFGKAIVFSCLILSFAPTLLAQSSSTNQAKKWIEDKIHVRVEKPYLDVGEHHLVLVYTLTNKTGVDMRLHWPKASSELRESVEMMEEMSRKREPGVAKLASVTVFFRLKDPASYAEVPPRNSDLTLADQLLPADLPVRFKIVVRIPSESKSWWFSPRRTTLRNALDQALGNAESIVIFVPDQNLKITFPIPSAR